MFKYKRRYFILILFILLGFGLTYLVSINMFPSYSLSRNDKINELTYRTKSLKINTQVFENLMNSKNTRSFLYDIYLKEDIYQIKKKIGQKSTYIYQNINSDSEILFTIYISNKYLPVSITHMNLNNKNYLNDNVFYEIKRTSNSTTYEFEVLLQDSYAYGIIILNKKQENTAENNYDKLFIENLENLIEIKVH